MKGYYFVRPNGKEILDIPYVLLDIWSRTFYNPNVLDERVLAWREELINLDNLRKAGWKIIEVDFPDNYAKKFRRECSKKKKRNVKRVVAELYGLSRVEEIKKQREFCDEQDIDRDDYENYWWLRGEAPPKYDVDESSYQDDMWS